VEVVGADDDLSLVIGDTAKLVAPFAHDLYRRLYGFSATIHGQDFVRPREPCEILVEERQLVVAERP
jgi:hypothetical protein